MRPLLYGYQKVIGRVIIHSEEALIVRTILEAQPGQRAQQLRGILQLLGIDMPECTLRDRIRVVLKNRRKYRIGKPAKNFAPVEALKIV
jgi:hypothetical protein